MEFNILDAGYSLSMARIAVTGGIGEGKSTVLGYLRSLGYTIQSADVLARDVFQAPSIQFEIARLVGCEPPVSAEFVRSKLDEPSLRRAINRITHPVILEKLRSSRVDFVEVPLLIETCLQGEFDRIWVVTCGLEEQLRRVADRLRNVDAARKIIGTQLASAAKIPFADSVIRTNCEESTVLRCVTDAAKRDLRG